MKLVSACLAGIECRYDCKSKPVPNLIDLVKKGQAIAVCPEELGELGTPRPAAEQTEAGIKNTDGKDVTDQYENGASAALKIATDNKITEAYLKSKSPMCGVGKIYDGSFSGTLTDGNGVFAQKLIDNGIEVHEVEGPEKQSSFLSKLSDPGCIIQLIFNLLITYFLAVAVYADFMQASYYNVINGIFTGSLLIMNLMCWSTFVERWKYAWPFEEQRLNWKILSITAIALIAWNQYIYNVWEGRSIWLDEYTQFRFANKLTYIQNILSAAGAEQQPPLDYYLSWFAAQFSWAEIAVRFHASVMGHIFIGIMCLTLYRWVKSYPAIIIALLLCFTNNRIIYYAFEARPYILSALFCLFFFNQFMETIKGKSSTIFLLSSQIIYTLTIGFQPVFIIISTTLSALIILRDKTRIKTFRKLFFSNLLAALVYIPFALIIIYHSISKLQFKIDSPLSSGVTELFHKTILDTFRTSFWFFPALIIVYFSFRYAFKAKYKTPQNEKFDSFISLFLLCFTPILTGTVFLMFINWELNTRYQFNYLVLTPILAGILIHQIYRRSLLYRPSQVILIIFITLQIFYARTPSPWKGGHPNYDWKKFYSELSIIKKKNNALMGWGFSRMGDWRFSLYVGSLNYDIKQELNFLSYEKRFFNHNIPPIKELLKRNPEQIIIISPKAWSYDDYPSSMKSALFTQKRTGNIRYFVLETNGNTKLALRKFIDFWKDYGKGKDWNIITHEISFLHNLYTHNFEAATKELKYLKAYPNGGSINNQSQKIDMDKFRNGIMTHYQFLLDKEKSL